MANELVANLAGSLDDSSKDSSLQSLNQIVSQHEEEIASLKKELVRLRADHDELKVDHDSLSTDHSRFRREYREDKANTHIDGAMQDDINKAVKIKGVQVLGGKKSEAYKNRGLRQKVYIDIYAEIKRQCGLVRANGKYLGYKHLPVKNFEMALNIIESYEPPISLDNEISGLNEVSDIIED